MGLEHKRRIKVLVIAEAANPEWVSVPLVGWSLANALRGVADVHLVTQIRNRQAILKTGLKEGKDFTVIDSEAVMKPLYKAATFLRGAGKGWTTVGAINSMGYYYFEYLLWKKFKEPILRRDFDIVHRITPLSPATPSLLAKKCLDANIPFVLGPLNGGVQWPKGFNDVRNQEKEWLSYVRGAYRLMPGYRSTLRSSSVLLIGSKDTLAQIPEEYHRKCIYLPENAIDPQQFHVKVNSSDRHQLKACFVGRLVPYKGPDMLIEAALPLLRSKRMRIDIIGDGPMMPTLQEFIKKEHLEQQVTLHGWVLHSKLQKEMCKAHIFAFPSIREFGGGVVLEAMALGLVPVVVDYAGPGELVTKETGFKVSIGNRSEIVASFGGVFEKIFADHKVLEGMSLSSIRMVNSLFTWPVKAKQVIRVYDWVLNRGSEKPHFFKS